eukprot:304062-Chlamydomonas_euryale.AAC.4
MYMLSSTRIALRASPREFSQTQNHPFLQTPSVLPSTCEVSYHPAPRLPGQFWRRILDFGTRFASLWAHPLPVLTLSQP